MDFDAGDEFFLDVDIHSLSAQDMNFEFDCATPTFPNDQCSNEQSTDSRLDVFDCTNASADNDLGGRWANGNLLDNEVQESLIENYCHAAFFDFDNFEDTIANTSRTSVNDFAKPTLSAPESDRNLMAIQVETKPDLPNPENRKRKFDDMVGCFPSRVDAPLPGRIRRAFGEPQRQKVAMMRKIKPCSRCKFRKVSCDFPGPCETCKKAAGSAVLARYICIRQPLVELRYGSFDFLYQSFTREWLDGEIGSLYGPRWKVRCDRFCDQKPASTWPLALSVQAYATPDSKIGHEEVTAVNGFGSRHARLYRYRNHRHAIVPDSIPKVADLLQWIQADLITAPRDPVLRFLTSLAAFMDEYCKSKPELPMHNLLYQALNVLKLLRCWRSIFQVRLYSESDDDTPMIHSSAISNQILLVIKEGICSAEFTILDIIEKLVYGSKGPGQDNLIPLWACLWSLILTYRDCMVTYKKWSMFYKEAKPDSKTILDSSLLIGASQHMYDIMTSVYAALFRVSTPLYLDWRREANYDLIGRSEKLKEKFYNLRTEVFWFYQPRDHFGEEDRLLTNMIIAQERKLRPRHPARRFCAPWPRI